MNATCSFPPCVFNLLAWLGLILEDTVTSSILHCLNVLGPRKTLTCTIAFPSQDDAHAHQDGDGLGAHNRGTGRWAIFEACTECTALRRRFQRFANARVPGSRVQWVRRPLPWLHESSGWSAMRRSSFCHASMGQYWVLKKIGWLYNT